MMNQQQAQNANRSVSNMAVILACGGLDNLNLSELSSIIRHDWRDPYFGALPYLDAMSSLNTLADNYGVDSAKTIVLYFLANAQKWRGPVARAVKNELNKRLKAK